MESTSKLNSSVDTIRSVQGLLLSTLRMSVMVMMPYGLWMVIPLALGDADFQWSGHGVTVEPDVMTVMAIVNHQ